jgi:hypothetical protein
MHYGVANQNGQVTRSVARAMLDLAKANNIDTLDTAIAYGDSESCLGEVGAQGFKIVTKLPAVPDHCADINFWVKEQVTASLSRLGLEAVYGLLLHHPQQLLETSGSILYAAIQDLKYEGLVQKIGISIYSPSELDALIPRHHFDLVQAPFNLVDRRLYISGWLRRLKDFEIEIHTRSAFLQGLLLMPRSAMPDKFEPWADLWDRWHVWLVDNNLSAIRASLAFPLTFPEIDRVVVGADSVSHLEQIISASANADLTNLPDLRCNEEDLINPARWAQL